MKKPGLNIVSSSVDKPKQLCKKKSVIHKNDLQLDERGLYYYHWQLDEEAEVDPRMYSEIHNVSYGQEIAKWIRNMLAFN